MTDYPKICPKCGKGYVRFKTLMGMSMRKRDQGPSKKVFFHELGLRGKTCMVESNYSKGKDGYDKR